MLLLYRASEALKSKIDLLILPPFIIFDRSFTSWPGLRDWFFSHSFTFHILFGLLYPFFIWTFTPPFYLDVFFIFFHFFSILFLSFSIIYLYSIADTFWVSSNFFQYQFTFLSCRFLELPSKVSTSLETLMDHIGVLYKFHDRPITYLYNTLHYFEHRIRERHTLKKTLVSSIVGSLKDVRPAGWCLTADYQGLLERSPKDNEEWKPGPDYYVRLVGRLVRSLQVSWISFSKSTAWNQNSIGGFVSKLKSQRDQNHSEFFVEFYTHTVYTDDENFQSIH